MTLNFKKSLALATVAAMFLVSTIAIASVTDPTDPRPTPPAPVNYKIIIPPPLSTGTGGIPVLIEKIISEAILPIGGVIVVIMIIYAGFMYVTAAGNETKVKNAHTALLYAVIGAAILLGARVLAGVIKATITQIGG